MRRMVHCRRAVWNRYSGLLALILFAGLMVGSAQDNPMFRRPQTRAVIVGISDYQNVSDLDYAHRDAEALAGYLQSEAGGKVPAEHIRLLLNEEATQMEFAMALDWLQEESRSGDRVYIYFSGHGDVEKKTSRQRGFLLNYDAPSTTYMAGGAFPILFLQDIVSTLTIDQGVEVILMADACRAGKLAGNAIGGNHVTAERLAESFANEIKILSCQQDELSQEGKEWGEGRGVFSYHLIEGLTGLADVNGNGDLEVDLRELRNYLERYVGEETAGQQFPMVVGDLGHSLVRVNEESLAQLQAQKNQELTEQVIAVNIRSRGIADPDSITWRKYRHFNEALTNKQYLYPIEGAAYTLYQEIKDEKIIEPYRNEMKRKLATALHDDAQQAINNYLQSPARELKRRWSYDTSYAYYPEYLGTAAKLLGDQHFMYEDLITRQRYFEGVQLRLQGEQEKALSYFEKALEKQEEVIQRDSTAAYAYNEVGLLYRRLDRKDEAIRYFELANDQSPTWVLPLANLSINYIDLGKLEQALDMTEMVLALDSTFYITYFHRGLIFSTQNKIEQAMEAYQRAIHFNPEFANSYYNLGLLFFGQDSLQRTEELFFEYADHMLEEEASIWSDLGYVATKLDKTDEAMRHLEKALSVDPDFANTYVNYGELFLKLGRLAEAEQVVKTYQNKKPDGVDGYYVMAAILARQDRTEAAIDQLRIAVEKGFWNKKQLVEDSNFDKLREKKGFKKLLRELE